MTAYSFLLRFRKISDSTAPSRQCPCPQQCTCLRGSFRSISGCRAQKKTFTAYCGKSLAAYGSVRIDFSSIGLVGTDHALSRELLPFTVTIIWEKKRLVKPNLWKCTQSLRDNPLIAVQTNTATSARIQHANSIVNFIRHAPSMAS